MTDDAGSAADDPGGTTEVWTGDPDEGDGDDGPTPEGSARGVPEAYREWDGPDRRPETLREWLRWFWTVETGPAMAIRELLSSALFVVAVGVLLFAVSGVWPPMVAVQSGSMEPHMHRGDLVFIVEEGRFTGQGAVEGTGVVTYQSASGYEKFGAKGDVVVYKPDGSELHDPIIHRARFYVEDGENWYDRADSEHVRARNCEQLRNCPAPNSGFITKGDNRNTNQYYDQAQGMSKPVKPSWVEGKAMVRVPWLGLIRLKFAEMSLLLGDLGRGLAIAASGAVVSTRLVGR